VVTDTLFVQVSRNINFSSQFYGSESERTRNFLPDSDPDTVFQPYSMEDQIFKWEEAHVFTISKLFSLLFASKKKALEWFASKYLSTESEHSFVDSNWNGSNSDSQHCSYICCSILHNRQRLQRKSEITISCNVNLIHFCFEEIS
jgi:hypothetical protein